MKSSSDSVSSSDSTTFINKLINNYNLYSNDINKHITNDLEKLELIIKSTFRKCKYDEYDSNKLKKLALSTNNVSWSFIILMIIFTIILLEPLII